MARVERAFWPRAEVRDLGASDRYSFAEYRVLVFDADRDAAFRQVRTGLAERMTPPGKAGWSGRLRPGVVNLAAEYQTLYAAGDAEAVQLYELAAPFEHDELALGRFAFSDQPAVPLWPWLEMVMDARRWRTDPARMKQAWERYEKDCAAVGLDAERNGLTPAEEADLRETGSAVAALHEGGLSGDEYDYWLRRL
jgi:hypothetical protein